MTPPNGDELAAIAAAFIAAAPSAAAAPEPISAWSYAMRHPEMEIDEIRARLR